jgi:SOS regulatory protein LexA
LGRLSREEECVRQWLIAELVDSYGFPLDCITVDKYIPDAHSRGYMDVTVAINRSGRVADFIYFKILQKEERFKDAVDQISVFMDYTPSCCYGVATNGRTLIIVDRTHKEVEDIPNFKPAWRLSSAVRYLYRNLKTKQQHVICLDPDDSTFLELEQGDNSEILDLYQLEEVNVYGCIAAGNPIQINEESEKVFYLPKMWCRGGKYFILNTTGDSMKGAAISDGDLVLVRSQSFAANMDIAVVALDNQGAIKRLRRKGKRVILQAENPHYESIEVSEDKVIILGIVVGILRPLPQAWNRGQLVAC